jgi:hypothetical protein
VTILKSSGCTGRGIRWFSERQLWRRLRSDDGRRELPLRCALPSPMLSAANVRFLAKAAQLRRFC